MELVFVHESGNPEFEGASEISEDSVDDEDEDEDEEGWGYDEFSSPDAGMCGASRGCALPSLEKVSPHSHVATS
jgi:hypothetical protein